MVLMRDTLEMMVRARGFFREEIDDAGGSLRVGLYDHDVPVDDLPRRTKQFLAGREEYPFLEELFPGADGRKLTAVGRYDPRGRLERPNEIERRDMDAPGRRISLRA